jgi:hypothetical protein
MAWIKIHNSSGDIEDTVKDFTEVLSDMGITVWNDEEKAEEEGVDLFIQIRNDQWRDKDILYVLTVSGDLATYYDGKYGENAFDALTPEQQRQLARNAERGLEGVGEYLDVAFDSAIEDLEAN